MHRCYCKFHHKAHAGTDNPASGLLARRERMGLFGVWFETHRALAWFSSSTSCFDACQKMGNEYMQRNEKHDKNLPHLSPWLGSGFGGPLWKATWLPVQVVQGGMHARAKDMTGPEYLLERALTKRFLRFAAFLAFLRLDFISFRNEVRSWVSFLISCWMTSWQQERTPKEGPDLGSISGTGTNGLDRRSIC